MKILFLSGALTLATCFVHGQNEEDILRYSYQRLSGTPRSLGMAGTMNTLGADLSVIKGNPAGLGFYRSNTYLFGLGFNSWTSSTSYIGESNGLNQTNLNIPNLGMSFTHINKNLGKEVKKGLVSYTLAFSLSRKNDFNQNLYFEGSNASSSILDFFAERSYGYPTSELLQYDNFLPGMAYNAYLINDDNTTPEDEYYANLPNEITMEQRNSISRTGRQHDFNVAMGFNISHRIYLGASLSLNTLRFEQRSNWQEQTTLSRSMSYMNEFTSEGSGFSIQLGGIVRLSDHLRAGAHYHSGTNYSLTDIYSSTISSNNFDPNNSYTFNSDLGRFNYSLRIPSRLGGGFSVILGTKGSLSAEVEHVNYGRGSLSSELYAFDAENEKAKNNFKDAYTLKFGGEILNGNFRFRGGYAYFGSPLSNTKESGYDLGTHAITAGLGYRNSSGFFVDFAAVNERYTSFYTPYTLEHSDRTTYTAVTTNNVLRLSIAVGSTF